MSNYFLKGFLVSLLVIFSGCYEVSGVVKDKYGTPIEGVNIQIVEKKSNGTGARVSGRDNKTDKNGHYSISFSTEAKELVIKTHLFSNDQVPLLTYTDFNVSDEVSDYIVNLDIKRSDLLFEKDLHGVIYDDQHNPLSGAKLTYAEYAVTSDANGTYRLPILTGEEILRISHEGYQTLAVTTNFSKNEDVIRDFTLIVK